MASRIYRTGKAISHSGHFMREWRLASCQRCWAHAGREVGCERLNEKTLNSLICHSFPRAFDPGSRQFTHQRSNNELEVNFEFELKQSEMHGFPYQNLYFDSDINTDLSRNSKLTFTKIVPPYNVRYRKVPAREVAALPRRRVQPRAQQGTRRKRIRPTSTSYHRDFQNGPV